MIETITTEAADDRTRGSKKGMMMPNQETSGGGYYQQQTQTTMAPEQAPNTFPGNGVNNKENDFALPQPDANKEESDDSDDDDDSFLDDDDEDVLAAIRQKRLAQLRQQQTTLAENKAKGHGSVRTISQDEFLPQCTSSKHVVVHFFHNEFERCKILDHHLTQIAPQHLECKFVRIDAEKAPFFVGKLKIQVLPGLLVFDDGKEVKRLLGFEGLSDDEVNNPDEWRTSKLQAWLHRAGAIQYTPTEEDLEEERESATQKLSRMGFNTSRLHGRFTTYDEDV